MKIWSNRFSKQLEKKVNDFNSSISFDQKMIMFDIEGSIAHAHMLGQQAIISLEEAETLVKGLNEISLDFLNGQLKINQEAEDIHMFIEEELTKRVGEVGKKLHTARSRNDQVALDLRLYLRYETKEIINFLKQLISEIINLSKKNQETIMPGYTHLQRAQPITLALHLMAYANMFCRDIQRLKDGLKRMNLSPLGSAALAGTTYDIDRLMVAKQLDFDGITNNSIDGVSDRDFVVELSSSIAIIMMHLSRFSEEIILWCSWEYQFIELDDSYSTGSSIMPQKKNPDIAELVRGKSGRCFGHVVSLLTMLKGLPLAYNKDMQEDKEAIFDSITTVKQCLEIFKEMLATIKINKEKMYHAALKGFINATDLADYLTKKGLPFRDGYQIVGQIVKDCLKQDKVLEDLTLEEYQNYHPVFASDVFEAISLENCIARKKSFGGAGTNIDKQIEEIFSILEE